MALAVSYSWRMGRARGGQASGTGTVTRRSTPVGVSDLQLGPTTFSARIECSRCGSSFTADTEALACDGFKADPNTHWFDGSATSVLRFYVTCAACNETVFVERDSIPILVQQAVYTRRAADLVEDGYKNYQLPRL